MSAERPRPRPVRLLGGAALAACLAAAALPGAATAARPAPARLSVTSLRTPPATLAAGRAFTVVGTVRNAGGRTAPALLALTLRAKAHPLIVYTLRGGRIPSVRPGRTAGFRIRVLPPTLKQAFPLGFRLQACVKTARTAVARCRKADGRVVLEPAGPPVDPTVYGSGARTLHDPLFPTIGNGGYDVQHYDLDLAYPNVLTRVLRGTATITARSTQNLKDFSFDFQGMPVSSVTVDGAPATFGYDFDASKLIVTPAAGIRSGRTFVVAVTYGGPPSPVIDPDGSPEGWLSSIDYGAVALGEPIGSQGWFPVNDVPFDKATYDIRVTAPPSFSAMSNGVLIATTPQADGTTTFHWRETHPMAPYLATVTVGRLDLSGSVMTNPARPLYVAFDRSINAENPANRATLIANQQRVPAILDWYAGYYGVPYPFAAAGGVVPRVSSGVGYVLETQTKPTYPSVSADTPGTSLATISHENAHQWFGDLVTLTRWQDIWLNEGLTEFSSWLWQERQNGGPTTASRFADLYATTSTSFWNIAPADPPSAADIFDFDAMYERGAMVTEGVREILGETAFRAVMHDWLTGHAYGNATTAQFVALVEAADPARAARWAEFFRQWLHTSYTGDPLAGNRPQMTPSNFDTYVLPTR